MSRVSGDSHRKQQRQEEQAPRELNSGHIFMSRVSGDSHRKQQRQEEQAPRELNSGHILLLIIFFPVTAYLFLGKIEIALINLIDSLTQGLNDYWKPGNSRSGMSISAKGSDGLIVALLMPLSLLFFLACLIPQFVYHFLRAELHFLLKLVVFVWDFLTYLITVLWFALNYVTQEIWRTLNPVYKSSSLQPPAAFRTGVSFDPRDFFLMFLLVMFAPSAIIYLPSIGYDIYATIMSFMSLLI
jgi:hypothetical protein